MEAWWNTMKLTKEKLQQIIKEEIEALVKEGIPAPPADNKPITADQGEFIQKCKDAGGMMAGHECQDPNTGKPINLEEEKKIYFINQVVKKKSVKEIKNNKKVIKIKKEPLKKRKSKLDPNSPFAVLEKLL